MPTPQTPADETPTDDPLLPLLDTLLEAERAGARVTLESIDETTDAGLKALLTRIHQDEVTWCGMLMEAIRERGAVPSSRTGDFYGKAMAITDPMARLAFLNRGQQWVAKRLRELLANMPDDTRLKSRLEVMLASHDDNIDRVSAQLRG